MITSSSSNSLLGFLAKYNRNSKCYNHIFINNGNTNYNHNDDDNNDNDNEIMIIYKLSKTVLPKMS